MDADAVIARAPTVALIDELAHTNAPGSVDAKRWEDVERIRDAGIHVVSTCNVQHLESMADAVETITGAPVRERIPDEVLSTADEIELVDMSPHALRQRMRHGNVYPEAGARIALDRFFTEENLTALRELSLRLVARRVEDQLDAMAAGRPTNSVAAVSERVLVLVDGSPAGRTALRRAADLAARIRADLVAVVASSPGDASAWERERAIRADVEYAADLGAVVVRLGEGEPATEIARVARTQGSTHLVLPYVPARVFRGITRPSLADRILAAVPGLEVHLIGSAETPAP
jgi:two-component system sensor histidine kinase KdpD